MFIRMLQFLAQAIPFILLCLAARKANLNKIDRGRQVLMPFIALLYCTIVAVILTQFHSLLIEIMGWISGFLPFLSNAGISHYMNLFNLLIVVIFLVLKGIFLPILNKTWKSKNLMQLTSGNFYEYEEDLDKWLLKKEYEQVKTYCNGIYYAALGASVLIFVLGQMYPKMAFAQTPCYPVFGVLVLGEVINYLSGISRTEFIEDVLGEDEESFKVANYGLLKDILKDLLAGISIIFDNKFAVGDTVEINGFSGTVIQLGLRTTKIKSFTGEIKSIGNSSFNEVINYSLSDAVLYIKLNVAYDTNLEKLEKVLSDIREDVLKIDGVITYELNGVDAFADSSIVYMVSVTCKAPNRYSAKRAFLRLVKDTFDKEKIEIPYTTVDINVRK